MTEPALYQAFPMEGSRRAQSWRHQPAHSKPWHFHAEPEINIVLSGWARLGLGRNEVLLQAGDFVFFAPGQDHVLLEASLDLDLFVFALCPELSDAGLGAQVLRSSYGGRLEQRELASWAARLVGVRDLTDATSIEQQLVELFRAAELRLLAGHATSRRALSEIVRHPGLSVQDVSARLGASRTELSRRVHADWGVPLVELRARTKLMRFVQAAQTGTELTRAALDADFGSYAQCHRVVRRILGCSPSEYLRSAQAAQLLP